ncbi:MAG: hypothetical protein WCO52_01195 [bacterium]
MSIMVIYFAVVVLLAMLGLVMILSFLRYRFKGDHTVILLTLFVILFFLTVFYTIGLLDTSALSANSVQVVPESF